MAGMQQIAILGKQFRQLFAVLIFHDDISLPYVRFCYTLWFFIL